LARGGGQSQARRATPARIKRPAVAMSQPTTRKASRSPSFEVAGHSAEAIAGGAAPEDHGRDLPASKQAREPLCAERPYNAYHS